MNTKQAAEFHKVHGKWPEEFNTMFTEEQKRESKRILRSLFKSIFEWLLHKIGI